MATSPRGRRPGRPAHPPAGLRAVSLQAAVEQYLREVRKAAGGLTTGTVTAKKSVTSTMLEIIDPETPVWTLTAGDFSNVMVGIQEGASPEEVARRRAEKRRPRQGRRNKDSLAAAESILRDFANCCKRHHWLDKNEVILGKYETRSSKDSFEKPRKTVRLSAAEVLNALNCAERRHPRVRIAMALEFYLGTRVSENVLLQWQDIDWDGRRINFWRRKGGDTLIAPLHEAIERELKRWRTYITEHYGVPRLDWYVVPNRVQVVALEGINTMAMLRREPWRWPLDMEVPASTETVITDFSKVNAQLGLPPGEATHTYRRSIATIMRDTTGRISDVQAFLGHKREATSQRYAGPQVTHDRQHNFFSGEMFADPSAQALPENVVPLRRRDSEAS